MPDQCQVEPVGLDAVDDRFAPTGDIWQAFRDHHRLACQPSTTIPTTFSSQIATRLIVGFILLGQAPELATNHFSARAAKRPAIS